MGIQTKNLNISMTWPTLLLPTTWHNMKHANITTTTKKKKKTTKQNKTWNDTEKIIIKKRGKSRASDWATRKDPFFNGHSIN